MDEKISKTLGLFVNGIYVLTTTNDDIINGMIASWVSQVSHDPPMIMVAVHPNRLSHRLIEERGCYAVHILSKGQKHLMGRFKGPDPRKKFDSMEWKKGHSGCPILKDCVGYVECVVRAKFKPGNHTLFMGEVVNADTVNQTDPLSTFDYDGVYTGKD